MIRSHTGEARTQPRTTAVRVDLTLEASGRAPGRAPDDRSSFAFASFADPDGNGWRLQEVTTRLPGRGLGRDVARLTGVPGETEDRRGRMGTPLLGLVALVLLAVLGVEATPTAQTPNQEAARAVQRMLERLPYYGVFDFIAFAVDRGTVTLVGYSFQGSLKNDAEMAAKRAGGVDEVVNLIDVLPASQNDDRIRWETFYRIYADDFLSRYAPGGALGVWRDLRDERRFPGTQPVGRYPIHIVVKNGRTMLLGAVDNAADRQIAEVRAREVTGVFGVDNGLTVVR